MDKFVFVKELKNGLTKFQKSYPIVVDQENEQWHIFINTPTLEIKKCYLFSFINNDKGFKDIQKITPLVNIFQQKALKEVANKNDLIRNISIATSYSISLVVGGKIPLDDLFVWADKIYDNTMLKADTLIPQEDVK